MLPKKKIKPQQKTPTHTTVMRFLKIHITKLYSRIVATYLFTWKKKKIITTQTTVTPKSAVCASNGLIHCLLLLRDSLDSVKA